MSHLTDSYAHCRQVAHRSTSSFYYSFLLLPRPKRSAMYALYAFLRHTDDLGDSDQPRATRRAALTAWRASLDRARVGTFDDPILPAVVDALARYSVPAEYLYAAIDGVEMDLDHARYATFAELELYCYRVASVVGLACIHVWGFRSEAALEPARHCGLAFQLTNILRDLKEDAGRDRVYLPQDDLDRFGYGVDDLKRGVVGGRFRALLDFEIARTEKFYDEAARLQRWLEPDGQRIFVTMLATYRGLLEEIKRQGDAVLSGRIRLSGWRKLQIATRGFLSPRIPADPERPSETLKNVAV